MVSNRIRSRCGLAVLAPGSVFGIAMNNGGGKHNNNQGELVGTNTKDDNNMNSGDAIAKEQGPAKNLQKKSPLTLGEHVFNTSEQIARNNV